MSTATLIAEAPQQEFTADIILDYISNFITLTKEETEAIVDNLIIKSYKKGTLLLKEGQIADECYFNLKGCVREFYLIDGEERTTNFFIEGDSITSTHSNVNRVPAKHYFECIEDCVLSSSTYEKEMAMYKKFPRLESLCRVKVEEMLGEAQETMARYMLSSPEKRYLDLLKNRPELLDRVPQYQLASYIGVKPESLSRIRKRISVKR